MTWIYDETGRHWVEPTPRKERKPARALKFANVKVGDQLMQPPRDSYLFRNAVYYLVTDIWFDPVAGQDDPVKGQMIGYATVNADGSLQKKSSTTVRGLASQQFQYADMDYIAMCKSRAEAMDSGDVIGIGYARTVRKRPKIAGL